MCNTLCAIDRHFGGRIGVGYAASNRVAEATPNSGNPSPRSAQRDRSHEVVGNAQANGVESREPMRLAVRLRQESGNKDVGPTAEVPTNGGGPSTRSAPCDCCHEVDNNNATSGDHLGDHLGTSLRCQVGAVLLLQLNVEVPLRRGLQARPQRKR